LPESTKGVTSAGSLYCCQQSLIATISFAVATQNRLNFPHALLTFAVLYKTLSEFAAINEIWAVA